MIYILIIGLFVAGGAIYAIKYFTSDRPDDRRKMDLAMVGLNQAIRKNPNDAVAFTKRGTIRFKKGDIAGALADLDRAIQLDPAATEAHYHRGMLLQSQGEFSKAQKEYDWILSHSEDPFYKTAASNRIAAAKKGERK